VCSAHRANINVHELLECYNVAKEEHDEDDPRNVQIPKTEGERVVEEPKLEFVAYIHSIKTQKLNIGTVENPKFAQIGDYWSDETVEKIVDLLQEYKDLFPMTFS
jgi:NADH:ubiquinone oxidoreductase subunit D